MEINYLAVRRRKGYEHEYLARCFKVQFILYNIN